MGLEADIGTGLTWETVPDLNAMLEAVEAAYGPGGAVDIQSYALWRGEIAAQPIVAVAAALQAFRPAFSGEIYFDTETNGTYLIHHTIDLCAWQEIKRIKSAATGAVIHPVKFREPQGFWRVTKFQTP